MNSDEKILQILNSSACLSKSQLLAYVNGDLYPEELRVVELHLSDCDFCNDAIDGWINATNRDQIINSLHLPELPRVAASEKKHTPAIPATPVTRKKEIKLNPAEKRLVKEQKANRPKNYSWLGGVGIAALLLLGVTLMWQEMKDNSPEPALIAQKSPENSETSPLDTDSFGSSEPSGDVPEQQTTNETEATLAAAAVADTAAQAATHQAAVDSSRATVQAVVAKATLQDSPRLSEPVTTPKKDIETEAQSPQEPKVAKSEPKNKTTRTQAAARQAEPPAETTPAPKADQPPSDYNTGLKLYREKKYGSALLYFRPAESNKSDPKHWDAVYYSAMCNLHLGKKGRAKRMFKRIVNAGAPQKSAAEKQLASLEESNEE